jgi:KDO2-lipid IV(A) lauroyltransferase
MDATRAPLAAEPAAAPVSWTHRFEAWTASVCVALLRCLPLDAASALGGFLARLIGPRLRVADLARRNLRAAFPGLSEPRIDGHIRVFDPGSRVETRGIEHLDRALAAGRRVILFGGHLANWEIAALAAAQYGLDIAQIYRAPNNPLIDRIVARLRGGGSELIPKGTIASRRAVAALRRGGHVSLLADQKLNEGIAVPFFGQR